MTISQSILTSKTSQCLIWLGEVQDGIALADARSAFEALAFIGGCKPDGSSETPVPDCLSSRETILKPMQALGTTTHEKIPCWQRIWTLQEAVLPFKACMLWGALVFAWEMLENIAEAYLPEPSGPTRDILSPHEDTIYKLVGYVRGIQFAKQSSFGPLDMAFRWQFRLTTNPLDKVYGLLGLCPPDALF